MTGAPFSDAYLAHARRLERAGAWPRDTPDVATGDCEDAQGERRVRIQLRLDPARACVADARFQAFGCSATLACASWVAEAAVGRSLAEAVALGTEQVARALSLPPDRASAAVLAIGALKAALRQAEPLERA